METVARGRQSAIFVTHPRAIVRSTTPYKHAAIAMAPGALGMFNNAMVERYSGAHRRMGFHCDMAIDLEPGSCIGIMALDDGDLALEFAPKAGSLPVHRQPLRPGVLHMFSVEWNAVHKHRIVCSTGGVLATLRVARLAPSPKHLVTGEQAVEFLHARRQENVTVGPYCYPPHMQDWTLSEGDALEAGSLPDSN